MTHDELPRRSLSTPPLLSRRERARAPLTRAALPRGLLSLCLSVLLPASCFIACEDEASLRDDDPSPRADLAPPEARAPGEGSRDQRLTDQRPPALPIDAQQRPDLLPAADQLPPDQAPPIEVAIPEPLVFPPGFLFGAAVSGFQHEMGCPTLPPARCEDEHSDWYVYITAPETRDSPATHIVGDPPSAGPGMWERYEEDIRQSRAEVGLNAFRFSVEWSRIFPQRTDGIEGIEALRAVADAEAIARYHRLLDALEAEGMTPFVTLNHYTLPRWLHDTVRCHQGLAGCEDRGWADRARAVREAAKYAAFVAHEFGPRVRWWATLNEPFAVLLPGYLLPTEERSNPPALQMEVEAAKEVLVALVEAHARMYDAVKEHDPESMVGVVYNLTPTKPRDPTSPLDRQAAANLDSLFNRVYVEATALGLLDDDLDGEAELRDDLVGRMDYLGINYYTRITAAGLPASLFPRLSPLLTFNPLDLQLWEEYPQGLYEMVRYANEALGLPAVITESGGGGPDEDRERILVTHLSWAARALRDGLDLRGYFYWTLIDDYEWNRGMSIPMGLYALEGGEAKARRRRSVAERYREIIEAGEIPEALQRRYPAP